MSSMVMRFVKWRWDGKRGGSVAIALVAGGMLMAPRASGFDFNSAFRGQQAILTAYSTTVIADSPSYGYWRLSETMPATAYDSSTANNTGTYNGSVILGQQGPLIGSNDRSVNFDGSTTYVSSTNAMSLNGTISVSIEAWVKTTATAQGVVVDFSDSQVSAGGAYTPSLYMGATGNVNFRVWNSSNEYVITSPLTYNDGNWHHVVATIGPAGMVLYVDGAQVANNASITAQSGFTGYWRIGNSYAYGWYRGSISEVAVYGSQLSATQVAKHYYAAVCASSGTDYTTSLVGGRCRWSFNVATGTFNWTAPVADVHIFAVGGGGGGGGAANQPYCYSGGGGGGYYAQGNYILTAGTSYTVVVGAGGAGGGSSGPSVGSSGGSSGVTGVVTANGGSGGGTTSGGADPKRNGGAGGSGGGCGAFSGGNGAGGANGSGGVCNTGSVVAGAGSGVTPYLAGYGSGGGGGGDGLATTGQPGGAGAGAGGNLSGSGSSATAFYGGGGGGAGCSGSGSTVIGGNGGAGVVIIDHVPQPNTIANLKLWLKADALSLADGDAVTTWSDSSANGYSVIQTTEAYKPIFKTNQINGKPVLRFNGSHMFMDGTFTGSITDKTMFVVVKLATLTPGSAGSDPVSIQSGNKFDAIVYSEYTAKRWHNGSDNFHRTPDTVSPSDETSTNPLLIAIRSTSSSYLLYRNGSQLQSTASYSPITFTNGNFVIGQRLIGTSNGYHNGDAAEVLIYDRALTDVERQQVEGYLNAKYAMW